LCLCNVTLAQPLNALKCGPYKVGLTLQLQTGRDGKALLICVWYPSDGNGKKINLKDYIVARALSKDMADTVSTNYFKRILELPFFYHLDKLPDDEYNKVLSMPLNAHKNALPVHKKFPLVIAPASPENYTATFEYLASNGFVVASVNAKYEDVANDTLRWIKPTNNLEDLLKYMIRQKNVDTARIAAFGHGGGIQAAFYLAMRTDKIKLLINLDGGVFGERSKTTLSPDYKPAMLRIPMLHLITPFEEKEDSPAQWNAISNPRYKVVIKSDSIVHHDFLMAGVVVANGLHKRGPSTELVQDVFSNVNHIMLYFLENKNIGSEIVDKQYFNY